MERVSIARTTKNPLIRARQMCWMRGVDMAEILGCTTATISQLERDAVRGELSEKRMELFARYVGALYGRGQEEAKAIYRECLRKRNERLTGLVDWKGEK